MQDRNSVGTPSILRDKASVARAIDGATSKRQVLERLRLRPTGGNLQQLNHYAELHGLDLPDGSRNANKTAPTPPEAYLVVGKHMTPRGKKLLIEVGILNERCYSCGIGPEWNGKPLTLQLDHVNGDAFDNRFGNLRMLCPNCHTQTDTWGSGHKGLACLCRCGGPKGDHAERCIDCYRSDQRAGAKTPTVCRCGGKKHQTAVRCKSCHYSYLKDRRTESAGSMY